MERGLLIALVLPAAACAKTTFGRVVTEVTVATGDPSTLVVTSCALTASKSSVEQVRLDDCTRQAVRRSAVTPVPVTDATVPHREGRFVTAVAERPGGGTTVTTCRIELDAGAGWRLADCAVADVSTAPHAAPP